MSEEKKSYEFDVIAMVCKVLKEWRKLFLFGFIGALVGVVIALCSPKYYTSDTALAPEFSGGSGGLNLSGGLADIAASFGVDLGGASTMDAIYPDLYPSVVTSTDFLLALYDVPVSLIDDAAPRSYLHHILHDFKIPFWKYPGIWLNQMMRKLRPAVGGGEANPFFISKDDWENIKMLRECILCSVDRKNSVISIAVIDQDPLVAAAVADTVRMRLQDYIIDYRTNKARLDIEYYTKLLEDAKNDYDSARLAYVAFAESHRSTSLTSYQVKADDLEKDMQVKYSIYTQTSAMLKQAESKFQERVSRKGHLRL